MNDDEINKMQAGREMDAAIAHFFYGFKIMHDPERAVGKFWIDLEAPDGTRFNTYPPHWDRGRTLPNYSEAPDGGPTLIVDLLDRNFLVEIVAFPKPRLYRVRIRNSSDEFLAAGGGNTLALAVCRAILRMTAKGA